MELKGGVPKGEAQRAALHGSLGDAWGMLAQGPQDGQDGGAAAKADTFLCLESIIMCFISIKHPRSLVQP